MINPKRPLYIMALFVISIAVGPNNLSVVDNVFAESSHSDSSIIQSMPVDVSTYSFKRISDTKAKATVKGYSSGITPFIKLKMLLQVAPLNSNSYTNDNFSPPIEYMVYDASYIYKTKTFLVTKDKAYRIKIELINMVNEKPIIRTYYCKIS